MFKVILSKQAKKSLSDLQIKYARQVSIKIKELQANRGESQDRKLLKGSKEKYYRVDVGEFRVIYQINQDKILIYLIGKRNDDEIYRLFMRKIK